MHYRFSRHKDARDRKNPTAKASRAEKTGSIISDLLMIACRQEQKTCSSRVRRIAEKVKSVNSLVVTQFEF